MKGIVKEGVTAKDPFLQMIRIQTSFERWGRRWMSWGALSKRRQSGVWIDWSEQPIHLSLQRSWNVQYHRNFGCLSLSHLTGLRTLKTILTPSRRHRAFSSPLMKYCVVLFPPFSKELQENDSPSCQRRQWITSSSWAMPSCATSLEDSVLRGQRTTYLLLGRERRKPWGHMWSASLGKPWR